VWFIQRVDIGFFVLSCVIFIEVNGCLASSKANISAFDWCIYNSLWYSWLPFAAFIEIETILFDIMKRYLTLISDLSLNCALIDLSCR
jgi:uncharacterized protein YggT (Ycf19 family)